VLRAYFARYAGILDFRRSFARQMRMDGAQFTNPFGRPRRIPLLFAAEKWQRNRAERMMMSSIISGTSADLMKEASLRAGPIARRFGGEYVQTIHDELVFDLPLKTGWTNCVQALKASMEHWPFFTETTVYRDAATPRSRSSPTLSCPRPRGKTSGRSYSPTVVSGGPPKGLRVAYSKACATSSPPRS
jgi:hypothetical protein